MILGLYGGEPRSKVEQAICEARAMYYSFASEVKEKFVAHCLKICMKRYYVFVSRKLISAMRIVEIQEGWSLCFCFVLYSL